MKKIFYTALVLGFFSTLSVAQAQQYACGGVIERSSDCNSDRRYHTVCCSGGVVHGVIYSEIQDQDHVDAIGAVCKNGSDIDSVMGNDFSRRSKTFACNDNETMVGIYSKDVLTEGGSRMDSLDGVTVYCKDKSSGNVRMVANRDIKRGREGREQMAYSPKKVVGIAYKELDKGSSDRADCVTLITK